MRSPSPFFAAFVLLALRLSLLVPSVETTPVTKWSKSAKVANKQLLRSLHKQDNEHEQQDDERHRDNELSFDFFDDGNTDTVTPGFVRANDNGDGDSGTTAGGGEDTSTCPPCPQCETPAPNSSPLGQPLQEEPLTLQILVVDSPGIITMGT